MAKRRNRTFNEIVDQVAAGNADRLMIRACLANRLAKSLKGKARASAYIVKHDALAALATRFPEQVSINKDSIRSELFVINFDKSRFGLHIPANEFTLRRQAKWAA